MDDYFLPPQIFDHAAQYFTVTDPRFEQLVNGWLAEGAVKEWKGTVGRLTKGALTALPEQAK